MIADTIVDGAPLRLHRIRKAHRADMRFPQRDQRIVVHRHAEIGRYASVTTLRGSPFARRYLWMYSSKGSSSGPPLCF